MTPGPDRPKWFVAGLLVIALVGLGVRVAYTLEVSRDLPFLGDAETYHLLADHLAEGDGYVRTRVDDPPPTAEFPPLFPAVLAVADRLGADSVTQQKLVTSVLGAVTVVLAGLVAWRIAGPATGLVAAGLAAVYPMLFQVDGALMAESLYAALITLFLLSTYLALDRPTSVWRWILAGAVGGLAALTRAEALLLVPVVLLPAAVHARRRGAAADVAADPDAEVDDAADTVPSATATVLPATSLLRSFGVGCAALVIVVLPWIVRDWFTFHQFIPISNNAGTLIAGANCDPVYDGDMKGLWRLDCVTDIDTTGLDEAEAFARYRSEGFGYAREHRGSVPGVVGVRVLRTFGLYDPGGQINWETLEGRDHTWQTVGHRAFLVLVPFAVAGLVALVRRRAFWWPLVAPFALVVFTAAISYGNERFRIVAEPGLLVLAAVGMTWGYAALRGRFTTLTRSSDQPLEEVPT